MLIKAEIVEMLNADSEPKWAVTIAQSLPKGDKMELVIQKGTEIGAYRVYSVSVRANDRAV